MIELNSEQKSFLAENAGHLLLTGGPGSGKTTVSIYKAQKIVRENLLSEQKVLFLSFARPSVARIIETLHLENNKENKSIEISTYHAFFWNIITSHGYLIQLPKKLSILLPKDEAIVLSNIRNRGTRGKSQDEKKRIEIEIKKAENEELTRIAIEEGKISFKLFEFYVIKILLNCSKITTQLSERYPFIILDEFQDTNTQQWDIIKMLGSKTTIMALADPEQRIYDFIGADPERLNQYTIEFKPKKFDLGCNNHRSSGTDIAIFGRDILSGVFSKSSYNGICCKTFPPTDSAAMSVLKFHTLERIKELNSVKPNWSLGILVPSKHKMRQISDYFMSEDNKPIIYHKAMIDTEGVLLSAEIISFLLQPLKERDFQTLIQLVIAFLQGRHGENVTKKDMERAKKLKLSLLAFINGSCKSSDPIYKIFSVYNEIESLTLVGDPEADWKSVRNKMESGNCPYLKEIALEAKNMRLLRKGNFIRECLADTWRNNGFYKEARLLINISFQQEHLAITPEVTKGVIIMNIHKAKGKQFDEVIIFEGPYKYKDRLVSQNDKNNISSSNRQNFMVAITRAKFKTSILTPKNDPCVLLIS